MLDRGLTSKDQSCIVSTRNRLSKQFNDDDHGDLERGDRVHHAGDWHAERGSGGLMSEPVQVPLCFLELRWSSDLADSGTL